MPTYKNGNTIVKIEEDGTKIRYVPDNQLAMPVYPESIDMKITNYCDIGCLACHEQSCATGNHADIYNSAIKLISSLHPYTEVAIGGGDPLSHPHLVPFLRYLNKLNVIANITVHWKSFVQNYEIISELKSEKLIHGIGVSVNEIIPNETIELLKSIPNIVIHTIIGIADKDVFNQFISKGFNVLLLGYKTFGRGIKYRAEKYDSISENTLWIRRNIDKFPDWFKTVSFDNLAIEQTELKSRLKEDIFKEIYMGDDGTFTMYIDLVNKEYAVSSTSKRHKIDSENIEELFANVRSFKE